MSSKSIKNKYFLVVLNFSKILYNLFFVLYKSAIERNVNNYNKYFIKKSFITKNNI